MDAGLEYRMVDAFTLTPYGGNAAGVILRADGLKDAQMQAIAAELGASETTFILEPTTRDAAVRFRWFTPGCEVGFCGHATLAGVHALLEAGRFTNALAEPGTILPIEFAGGILEVRTERQDDPATPYTIWLDIPRPEPKKTPVNVPLVARHLGLAADAIDPAVPAIRTHDDDVILAVRDLPTLLSLQPQMTELARYCRNERIRGVLVTTTNVLSRSTVVQSRFFAPAAGVDEDPVTGSVHGPLGLHLAACGVVELHNGRADFLCAQAKSGGRAGIVRVVVHRSADGAGKVRVGGSCVTTASGTLLRLPPTS